MQEHVIFIVSNAVQEQLGWGSGQCGDVVCFLGLAYRKEDQSLATDL
jgi:hypothetical protein